MNSVAKIFRSSVINAPIDEVWAKIRDFNALPDWHPAFTDSHIENDEPGDKVGSIRNFNLKDGGNIRERLLTLSDVKHLCTYTILESPLPLQNYVATLRLAPVTDGNRTYAEWTAEFNCRLEEEDGLVKTIGDGVFQGGFDALKTAFAG
jgi:polyketide cyclase/dehydrase/lipid transport protein